MPEGCLKMPLFLVYRVIILQGFLFLFSVLVKKMA